MKTTKLTIASQLPIFTGFYGTIYESNEDHFIDDYNEQNNVYYNYEDFKWDNEGYMNEVGKGCTEWVQNALKEIGFDVQVDFIAIDSPREYNHSNDAIDVNYTINKTTFKKIVNYLKDNSENWNLYIKGYFTSYSGFISFHPNNAEEWVELVNLDNMANYNIILKTILGFILTNEDYSETDMYNTVYNIEIQGKLIELSINELDGYKYTSALNEYRNLKGLDLFVFDFDILTMIDNDPKNIKFTYSGDLIIIEELKKFEDPNQLVLF